MMNKIFDSVKVFRPRRNKFDLSQEKKLTMDFGWLTPVLVEEVVPGDSFRVKTESLVRLSPLIAPVMQRMNCYMHYFFVPNRLVWDEWEDFITGGRLGTAAPVFPFMSVNEANRSNVEPASLADYLGIPTVPVGGAAITTAPSFSVLPFRAYQLIYNEYFRDQNLEADLVIPKTSGQVTIGSAEYEMLNLLRIRNLEKDYFTSALPWAQRGGAVSTPISGEVDFDSLAPGLARTGAVRKVSDNSLSSTGALSSTLGVEKITAENVYHELIGAAPLDGTVDVSEFRRAIRLQEWVEKNARAGSRYIEQILSHFGVRSSDARLQRPEFLGGGRTPIVISESLSTAQTTDLPQANMAGRGISVGTSYGFNRSFEEHGYIIGVMSALPRTGYQDGVPKHYSKFDKFDFFWPEFANLGEQAVINREVYFDYLSAAVNGDTFGYQSRYAEYKYGRSSVHGLFRGNLAFWHANRIFSATPVLNNDFVQAYSTNTDRMFAVFDDEARLMVQLYHDVQALRPMPYFGVPSI